MDPDLLRAFSASNLRSLPAATLEQLARLKGRADPDNVLRLNHNVVPA